MKDNRMKSAMETSNRWYKNQERKEEQEVQNILQILDCRRKSQYFQEYE